jgi:hypothetical protein
LLTYSILHQQQSRHLLKDNLIQEAYDELTGAHVESSSVVSDNEEQQKPEKKRKYLKPGHLRTLDYGHKVAKLNEYL